MRIPFFRKHPESEKPQEVHHEPEPEAVATSEPSEESGQLLNVLNAIKSDERVYSELVEILFTRNPEKFHSIDDARNLIELADTNSDALRVAKFIDATIGRGTFRTLSFIDSRQDASRSVYKILKRNIEDSSFEKKVEKGYYLNLLETYGVEWDLEKVSRDSLQNFFDANGQTLDGIDIDTQVKPQSDNVEAGEEDDSKTATVRITGPQDYDWRELVHFGGTTKGNDLSSVGGFGEGLKIAAFVLLRDQGATKVRAASRDWEMEYYLDKVASDSYREPMKGLHVIKRKRVDQPGNYLEIVFKGKDADKKAALFEQSRELFFSSDNPDFKDASYDNKESGGFKVLLPKKNTSFSRGHLYLAGQRTHYEDRTKWATVQDVNIWTWFKVQPKDRDRGMITYQELEKDVIPLIVESMSVEDLKKAVFDFQPLWDNLWAYSAGYELLEQIVNKLSSHQVTLEFEDTYLANDIPQELMWVKDAMKKQGFKMCVSYLKKIGMKSALTKLKELQTHSRVEASPSEEAKINILKEAGIAIGLTDDEIKNVWLFDQNAENNIFIGQYNGMFYWLSRESLSGDFFDVLNTYAHEAAHKVGPHGKAEFEYYLEQCKQKITKYILEHREEWREFEQRWNSVK